MIITVKKMKELNACPEGIVWLKAQPDKSLPALVKAAITGGRETMEFANWGLTRLMTKPQAGRYACYAAWQVLKIFEDKYPDDKRPRRAIEAAEAYAAEPTEANRLAAAAYAASAYAAAAAPAADAAYAAATAAAYAAAAAASAAAASVADAAYAAAADAAADANRMRAEILRYGVKLLLGAA